MDRPFFRESVSSQITHAHAVFNDAVIFLDLSPIFMVVLLYCPQRKRSDRWEWKDRP